MKLLSVNVAQPREITHGGHQVMTGIYKTPVPGRVRVRALNIDGDQQADLNVHGGVYKAVYAYPHEHYAYWSDVLHRNDFSFGQFGENLTTEGLREDSVHLGDVLRVGAAVLQVTQPRIPCFKLTVKMNDPRFAKPFLASGRVGFYFRVLEEGEIGAGDPIEIVRADPQRISVRDAVALGFGDDPDREGLDRALRVEALSPSWREVFERRLSEVGKGKETPSLNAFREFVISGHGK